MAPRVTGFSAEPEVGDAMDSLREVEALAVVGTANFELRILRVPWLRFEAFWLHSDSGDEDVVVPYAGFPNAVNLQLKVPYDVSWFLDAIQPKAQQIYADWVRQQVNGYQKGVERVKAQADRHHAAQQACLVEAARMEARAKVLEDVNRADAREIQLALDLDNLAQAEALVQSRKDGWRHLGDLLKAAAKQPRVKEKIQSRCDRLGFGQKVQRAGTA
jgi:hypothetical protein